VALRPHLAMNRQMHRTPPRRRVRHVCVTVQGGYRDSGPANASTAAIGVTVMCTARSHLPSTWVHRRRPSVVGTSGRTILPGGVNIARRSRKVPVRAS